MRWALAKNSSNKPDTMLTFSWVAFIVVIVKVLFGGMAVTIGKQVFTLAPIDPTMVAALLAPTLGAYVARRYTDRKFIDANNDGVDDREQETVK